MCKLARMDRIRSDLGNQQRSRKSCSPPCPYIDVIRNTFACSKRGVIHAEGVAYYTCHSAQANTEASVNPGSQRI
jgi:hypothetical protein